MDRSLGTLAALTAVFVVVLVAPEAASSSASLLNGITFSEAGTIPTCPADLFDHDLVTVTCYQDWERQGRWFIRLLSSGIPAHAYGEANESWTDLVVDQHWDVTIPLISEDDYETNDRQTLERHFDPAEFLTAAARQGRPVGMALNGVPFFSPLSETGVDMVNPLPGSVAENDTLFDACAGSLQPNTGAYGYRVMPPCLHSGSSSVPEGGNYNPALAILGFEIHDSSTTVSDQSHSMVAASPLLGFAMDGRRIYGPFDSTGSLARGLDLCNGRWEINGRSNETAVEFGLAIRAEYTYRATPDFPYLIGCFGPPGVSTIAVAAAAGGGEGESDNSGKSDRYIFEEDTHPRCPAGSYLSVETGLCRACEPGSYGKDSGLVGTRCPGVCPRGYYCAAGTASPFLRCPAGTFGAREGIGERSCSGECKEGYFCLSGSVMPDSIPCGSEMYYCPRGSGQRQTVSIGYYTTSESPPSLSELEEVFARRTRSNQSQCKPGTYCTGGRRRFCPVGTFGAVDGLASSACSGPCPAGSYCPEGTVKPILCPAGTYGDEEGLADEKCSGLCALGHYCRPGSISAFQEACPAGRFGAFRGLKDAFCAEEHACARVQGGKCLASLCAPGHYCPAGSNSSRANACGSVAVFCPLGSALPSPVDGGYYTYSEGAAVGDFRELWSLTGQENTLGANTSQTRTAQAECEPGYYCAGGDRILCPAGTFGSSTGLSSPECSGLCPAGYFCRAGLAVALEGERCGGPQWYCPEGSGERLEVGDGNYTVKGAPDRRIKQVICPAGTYCKQGVTLPCSAGTYGSLPGLSSPVCSGLCPAGRYCPAGTSPDSNGEIGSACPAGRYGMEGMRDSACAGLCHAGFYCPEGSTSAKERECGSEYLFCPEGSGFARNVTAGWYATGGEALTRTGQVACPAATGDGGRTPPSGLKIIERCPDKTVGWNGTTVLVSE